MIPLLVLLALVVSALFSGAESVVLTAHRLRLASGSEAASRWAERFAGDPSRALATILAGNSLANVFAASLATLWVARRWGEPAVWVAVVVVALLVLIVGEILPKSFARAHADRLAEPLLPAVAAAYVILRPWVSAVSRAAWALLAATGYKRGPIPLGITRQELQVVVAESEELLRLAPVQARILRRVFDFAETPVQAVMAPRTHMVAVPLGTTAADAGRLMVDKRLSRLPVYRDDLDHVVGILHRIELFRAPSPSLPVDGMLRPVAFVPETKHCAELLREMQARRQHLAIVLDEYGGTAGLVTQEDLIEELVGEIRGEHEQGPIVRRLDALTVAVPGSMRLEELRERMGVALPEGDYDTVAGLILERLGRVPQAGETVSLGRYRLEVLSADRRRIEQVALRSERPPRGWRRA